MELLDLELGLGKMFVVLVVFVSAGQCSGTKQVIDIFTNYPSTREVLQDYNRLLESRQSHFEAPRSSSEFLTKTHKIESGDELSSLSRVTTTPAVEVEGTLPRTITASVSTPIAFETRANSDTRSKKAESKLNLYSYSGTRDRDIRNRYYEGTLDDFGYGQGSQGYGGHGGYDNHDSLESEFGTFETSNHHDYHGTSGYDSYSSGYQGAQGQDDLQAQASINHAWNSGIGSASGSGSANILDLNNFIEVMATRPSFLTGSSSSTSLFAVPTGNRRNKTLVLPSPDFMDFDLHSPQTDVIESDFGEIVSTTVDKNKKRKGNVHRIPRPTPQPIQSHNPSEDEIPKKGNNHHVSKLYQLANVGSPASKLKVTNLIRRYLIKMRKGNATRGGGEGGRGAVRRNRKQAVSNLNSVDYSNDVDGANRTFDWLTGHDKKTELQTSVKLHEGSAQKYLNTYHTYTSPLETIKNKTKHIANKFLSLFTVIQFANFKCQANSAVSQYEGTCYLASECTERNGVAMGMCAEGHGVCCVFRGTCGGVGSNNCTYFESPGYPNYFPQNSGVVVPTASPTTNPLTPDPRFPNNNNYIMQLPLELESRQSDSANALSCIFRVYKSSPNVKQMRIDFIDLELSGPTNGVCVNESLVISGIGLTNGVPPICGYNTGQHVLVDVSNLSGPLQLAVLANQINRKRYKIRICQYTDGCSGLMNCLQSYTGVTGTIQSFNYDQASSFSRSTPGYFNNLNYAICIRREPGYCSITYSTIGPNGVVYPFMLRNFDVDGTLTVPAGEAGAGVINCPDDYIVINGIRLCGDRLNDGSLVDNFAVNAPVTDTSGGPIIIPVRTNGVNTSRGFKLFYTQNRCMTSGGAAGTPDPRS